MPARIDKPSQETVFRERTFDIVAMRDDKKDALAQMNIAVQQLIEEKITGQVIIHLSQGGISSVQVKQIKRL